MYESGRSVPADPRRALALYEKAAAQGIVYAQTRIGVMYRAGRGVQADVVKAQTLLSKAADLGDPNAYVELGNMAYTGADGKQDYAVA
ncbi:tetratricopeptide repeat protein, partial [Acinetobacter baumannii]